MDDFRIDARKWRFLNSPRRYAERDQSGLRIEPLERQFKTAKDILSRLASGRGVLLADDVGLGKTTVGALVAWVVACQDKRVRIYAPNKVMRRRWSEELEKHVPLLSDFGASHDRIKTGEVGKLHAGRIQVATHHSLVESDRNNEQRTGCDLMIIDEAHRAKGQNSGFHQALRRAGDRAKRKLILTATPFSIRIAELEQLLEFVGATELDAVRRYALELERLHSLGEGHDPTAEAQRLVCAARAAIEQLQPYLIRHGLSDLSATERKHFGAVSSTPWEIATTPVTQEELALLLRVDRLLQLTQERSGERRNDPRFHVGWQHVETALEQAGQRAAGSGSGSRNRTGDSVVVRHVESAKDALRVVRRKQHPKIAAVSAAIRPLLDAGEKVLLFCHHRATASELLRELEQALQASSVAPSGPPEAVWRAAWTSLFADDDPLLEPIIDWLCTPGVRRQVSAWVGTPAHSAEALARQLCTTKPRNPTSTAPTISEAAKTLTHALLDRQSTSTRAVLRNIAKDAHTFDGQTSHFPGRLDDGLPTMGAWHQKVNCDAHEHPQTLYTGEPDIVLRLFNSPFGPDVLVTTDYLSEGVDLHHYCRHLIHYELDPSPVRTLQRNGRIRRIGSWAAHTGLPIRYAYPTFGGTRDEKAVAIMRRRVNAFGLLLGGVPSICEDTNESEQGFADAVLSHARDALETLNVRLCVAGAARAT